MCVAQPSEPPLEAMAGLADSHYEPRPVRWSLAHPQLNNPSLRVRKERVDAVTPRFHEELLEKFDARGLVFLERVESFVLSHLDGFLQPIHRHEMLRPREIDLNQTKVTPDLE